MNDTSSRLLALLSLLQARRDWPGSELASRLEVSRRTVRRDVERLRELGYPVESLTGPAGGYTLRAGTAMPPLLLDDEEAVAIAVGLRTAAGVAVAGIEETAVRALVKLEQVLPRHLRRRVAALGWATSTPPAGGPAVDPEHLTAIATASRDAEHLRFAYRDREGNESRREVEPYSVVNLGLRWYLVAWDPARDDWRTFRVDRLSRPASTGIRFSPRELPAKDAATYVEESLAAQPYRYQARVVLHAPVEEIRRHLPSGWGTVQAIGENATEYRTGDDDLQWLALRVAMLGVDFEVREPPELGDQLRAIAKRLRVAAGSSPPRRRDSPAPPS